MNSFGGRLKVTDWVQLGEASSLKNLPITSFLALFPTLVQVCDNDDVIRPIYPTDYTILDSKLNAPTF